MTPVERLRAYRSGVFTRRERTIWAARFPEEAPLLNGELEWIARDMGDLDRRVPSTLGHPEPLQGADYHHAMATRFTVVSDWLAANPPAASSLTETLARVAERTLAGEEFSHGLREFLGEFPLRADDSARERAISERPEPTGDPRHDAYLGALAEHIAALYELERPSWSVEPDRFLETWWFVSDVPGFRAISIAQAPAAFVKHGVFVPERSLHRV